MRSWLIPILLGLAWSWTGCSVKPVVLPDSHVLRPGMQCQTSPEGQLTNCVPDPGSLVINKGYLREIMDRLEACPH